MATRPPPTRRDDREDRDEDYRRKDPAPAPAPAPAPNRRPPMNEYFIEGEGIHRAVLQGEICKYLGAEAICRPGNYNGKDGFYIKALRPFTQEMIDDLKRTSAEYANESRYSGERYGREIRYEESAARERLDRNSSSYERRHTPEQSNPPSYHPGYPPPDSRTAYPPSSAYGPIPGYSATAGYPPAPGYPATSSATFPSGYSMPPMATYSMPEPSRGYTSYAYDSTGGREPGYFPPGPAYSEPRPPAPSGGGSGLPPAYGYGRPTEPGRGVPPPMGEREYSDYIPAAGRGEYRPSYESGPPGGPYRPSGTDPFAAKRR